MFHIINTFHSPSITSNGPNTYAPTTPSNIVTSTEALNSDEGEDFFNFLMEDTLTEEEINELFGDEEEENRQKIDRQDMDCYSNDESFNNLLNNISQVSTNYQQPIIDYTTHTTPNATTNSSFTPPSMQHYQTLPACQQDVYSPHNETMGSFPFQLPPGILSCSEFQPLFFYNFPPYDPNNLASICFPSLWPQNNNEAVNDSSKEIELSSWTCACGCNCNRIRAINRFDGLIGQTPNKQDKSRSIKDVELFEKLLISLGHHPYDWLDCFARTKEGIKKIAEIIRNRMPATKLQELMQYITAVEPQELHVDDALYMKDNNLFADGTYHNTRKEGLLLQRWPNLKSVVKNRHQYNIKIENELKLAFPNANIKGCVADVEVSILKILELYYALGGKKKNKIFFKISVDGRAINGVKQVAITVVPINLSDVFPSQAVYSVFYIGLFQMTETEESIESCIGVLSESIKSIQLEMNKSDENNFKLFYVSDMHNVGHTFNFCVCPYCKASHLYDFLAEKRTTIEGALPFQPHQIIMCILHVKQRLVENTVAYIASSVEWKDVVEGNLTKLPGLETFKWRELKERVSQYGVPTTCERSTVNHPCCQDHNVIPFFATLRRLLMVLMNLHEHNTSQC